MNFVDIWKHVLQFTTANNSWLIQLALIIVITFIASFVEKTVYLKLYPKLVNTSKIWDDAFLFALHKPLKILIWFSGLLLSIEVILTALEPTSEIIRILHLTESFLVIATVMWFLIRYIKKIEDRYIMHHISEGRKIERSNVHAIGQLSRIFIVLMGVLVALQIFGIPISGLLAVGGMGGLVLGFAAKDTLANFFGGFMIFFDRPFTVGDWIYSPDRDIEGTVEYIGWRLTRIRRFDQQPLYLPNGVFSTIGVVNASRMKNRRITTTIGIRYADANKLANIVEDAERMLRNHPEIDTDGTYFVKFISFGESSLNLQIYAYTKTTDWVKYLSVQQDIYLKVINLITQHGAEYAFPTTTLEVPHPVAIEREAQKE